MKRTITLLFFVISLSINAQVMDVSINPVGAILGSPDLSLEYIATESIGINVTLSSEFGKPTPLSITSPSNSEYYKTAGFGYMLMGKYYTSPDDGCDGFYVGFYYRNKKKKFEFIDIVESWQHSYNLKESAMGLSLGNKTVWDNGMLIDFGVGFGRFINLEAEYIDYTPEDENNLPGTDFGFEITDFIGTFSVGYRF